MTDVGEPFGIGLVGWSAASRFVCERLSLRSDLRLMAVCANEQVAADHCLSAFGAGFTKPRRHETAFDLIHDPAVRAIYFTNGSAVELLTTALRVGKSIILESPCSLDVRSLKQLTTEADATSQNAVIFELKRWDTDFLLARSVLDSGRLGQLLRLRYSVHDYGLPDETYPFGVAQELGVPILDQMLQMIGASVLRGDGRCVWRHFPSASDRSEGFFVSFDFADGVSAIIEIHTRSLLGFRTGWMIEGANGAYRNGRLYTQTVDGEIVDEPWPVPMFTADPFFDGFAAALRGQTHDLPTVRDAVRVAALLCDMPE